MRPLVAGNKILHYTIIRVLGEGGMGVVYLAHDERLKREVAIKCLKNAQNQEQDKLTKRLRNEATILAQLNHPHVVQIYDIIDADDRFYIVMEYVNGTTLDKYLLEHIVNLQKRIHCLTQVISGIAFAHSKGLVHRDIKQDNILVNTDGTIKITDFGIAKSIQTNSHSTTHAGTILGSVCSLSPEQALGKSVEKPSDIFSFGILAYQVLCGSHPFGSTTNHHVLIQNILHHAPLPAKVLNPHLPAPLITLLNALLHKNPSNRPYALDVKRELETCSQTITDINDNLNLTETKDIDIDDYGTLGQYNQSARIQNDAPKNNKIKPVYLLAALCIILIASFSAYWSFEASQKTQAPQYIAIMPVNTSPNSLIAKQQRNLLENTIASALDNIVMKTTTLHLTSTRTAKKDSLSYSDFAAAVAADVIIDSHLHCENNRCQLNIKRIERSQKNGDTERWITTAQQSWPISMDDQYLNLTTDLERHFSLLFNDHSPPINTHAPAITEADHQWFMTLRHDVLNKGIEYKKNWDLLTPELTRFYAYAPYYELLGFLAIKLFDDTQEAHYLNRLNQAIKSIEQISEFEFLILELRFDILLREKNTIDANRILDRMKAVGFDKVTRLKRHALLEHFSGNYQKANDFYQQAINLRPTIELHYSAAVNHWHNGDIEAAKKHLEQVFVLNPNEYDALVLSASIHLTQGHTQEAIAQYRRILLFNSEALLYNNLGLAYELAREYDKAIESFKRAIEQSPDHANAILNLADAYTLSHQSHKAKALYQRVINMTEGDGSWEALQVNALAKIQLGQTHAALKAISQALSISHNNPNVLLNAALIYTQAKQWQSAIAYIDQTLSSGVNTIWFTLPWFDPLCDQVAALEFNTLLEFERCSLDF